MTRIRVTIEAEIDPDYAGKPSMGSLVEAHWDQHLVIRSWVEWDDQAGAWVTRSTHWPEGVDINA